MFSLLKFILLISIICISGFAIIRHFIDIKSKIILYPISVITGLATFFFLTHTIAYLTGPKVSSGVSLIILLVFSIYIFWKKKDKLFAINKKEITTSQNIFLLISALIICTLTYLAIYRYGTFDRDVHIPLAATMFHNNTYPPQDPFRPDYVLLYHFGGDLLAGTIYNVTGFDISTSYELVSTILSGTTFLGFIALAWILSKNFALSYFAGFCTYFGGGLLWLDAIIRYLTKSFPDTTDNWTFLQTFLNLGIHGSINNAPSVLAFTSTFAFGTPLLICSFILFKEMIEIKSVKKTIPYLIILNIVLFAMYMTTDWLYVTFFASAILFLIVLWLKKHKNALIPISILIISSAILVKTLGNPLFLQDAVQSLGRTNIFDVGIKEQPFTVVAWGRLSSHIMNYQTISCFSWDFICEFGFSLFLLPVAIYYVVKTKNIFAVLLALSVISTMPIPPIIDFKLNPVELVRLFAFGNNIIILFIILGLNLIIQNLMKNKILLVCILIGFCTSPIAQLISGIVFTPQVFANKMLVERMIFDFKNTSSFGECISYYKALDKFLKDSKDLTENNFKNEIEYLKAYSKPGEAALSSHFQFPAFGGRYSYIPPRKFIYWDQLYSGFNSLHHTSFTTLDPFLLDELKIKWVIIDENFKSTLSSEILDRLNNKDLFELKYSNTVFNRPFGKTFEIYYVKDHTQYLEENDRLTAWVLVNKQGQLFEIVNLSTNKISFFGHKNDALTYFSKIQKQKTDLGKVLITAQPIVLNTFENELKNSNFEILIDKKF
ncbi:MAG: hypothetical protein HYR97_03100 [Candidatus Melainabacteria bacterium]|nr:hypothetical protein [Candidatus Melainabacteria bacterium]